ncbi:hypothetical protein [Neobacillus sp. FSL H8-0543]|uniref:hypothetical protein n=1 Tax=Neobacillus sp. FSL H8-0543 TaxID=2954672 RepID=UPI0031591B0A
MLAEKEAQLQQFTEISKAMLGVLDKGDGDQIPGLLEKRQGCILTINKLDEEAGKILMNEQIQELLKSLAPLEAEILKQLQEMMNKLSDRMRYEQNAEYLKSQYEERETVSKGVFYDSQK